MIVKQIRLSQKAKERLSRLKSKTGISNWNVLCRWAFCYSLKQGTIPANIEFGEESNLEMSWYTFAGENSEIYDSLMIAWCKKMGLETDSKTLAKYFRLNLERGISYLAGTKFITNIENLLQLVTEG